MLPAIECWSVFELGLWRRFKLDDPWTVPGKLYLFWSAVIPAAIDQFTIDWARTHPGIMSADAVALLAMARSRTPKSWEAVDRAAILCRAIYRWSEQWVHPFFGGALVVTIYKDAKVLARRGKVFGHKAPQMISTREWRALKLHSQCADTANVQYFDRLRVILPFADPLLDMDVFRREMVNYPEYQMYFNNLPGVVPTMEYLQVAVDAMGRDDVMPEIRNISLLIVIDSALSYFTRAPQEHFAFIQDVLCRCYEVMCDPRCFFVHLYMAFIRSENQLRFETKMRQKRRLVT